MVQRLNQSYSFGIRNFLVALPAWGALQGDELFDFWHILCDPFPDCLFLHYNNMRSKRIISMTEYEKLADEIPNLAGAKYSTTDLASILDLAVSDCPLRFFLTERGYAYGSLIGDFGFLLSIATTNVNRACQFFLAGVNKEYDMLIDMQKELHNMQKHLIMIAGDDKIDGAYDKIFCKRLNPSFPLRLLPPYRGVTDEAYASYINFLENHYPQWLNLLS
jgi:dihydrodipicolinate synthase/N-acetylneuraminate lyase